MIKQLLSRLLKSNDILSLLNNIAMTFFGLLGFVLLARSLDQQQLGIWIIYITAVTMIEMIRSGLTRIAMIRFLSGASTSERDAIIGTNWLISITLTAVIIVVIYSIRLFFREAIIHSDYAAFFTWYPLLAVFNLPYNTVLTLLQAGQNFSRILWLRTIESGAFVLYLLLNFFFMRTAIDNIIIVHLLITLFISVFCFYQGLDILTYIRKANRRSLNTLLHFGKYSLGTLIGSNLLKSTDTFVISASTAMGAPAVALYGVPLKLIEILEVPLRSFVATAFPRISQEAMSGDIHKVKKSFYAYAGFTTLLFIPIIIIVFFATDLMILLLAGKEYLASSLLLKIFCVYGLLLPIDRFSGVVLDALNFPKLNFYKVAIMALINLVGDGIAVFYFHSLIGVAVATIAMTFIGVLWGVYFLHRQLNLNFKDFFIESGRLYRTLYYDIINWKRDHDAD